MEEWPIYSLVADRLATWGDVSSEPMTLADTYKLNAILAMRSDVQRIKLAIQQREQALNDYP